MPEPREFTPELALVDPLLAERLRVLLHDPRDAERLAAESPPIAYNDDVRRAARRISELSDVNPPRKPRARPIRYLGVAALWIEVILVAADARLGLY